MPEKSFKNSDFLQYVLSPLVLPFWSLFSSGLSSERMYYSSASPDVVVIRFVFPWFLALVLGYERQDGEK